MRRRLSSRTRSSGCAAADDPATIARKKANACMRSLVASFGSSQVNQLLSMQKQLYGVLSTGGTFPSASGV